MIKYFLFLFLFAAGCAHSMVEPEAGPIDENAVTRDGHRAIGGLMGRRDKAMKILGLDKPAKKKVTL